MDLVSLIDRFPCDDKCRDFLEDIRWPHGPACTRCGDMNAFEIGQRNQWECQFMRLPIQCYVRDYHARFPPSAS